MTDFVAISNADVIFLTLVTQLLLKLTLSLLGEWLSFTSTVFEYFCKEVEVVLFAESKSTYNYFYASSKKEKKEISIILLEEAKIMSFEELSYVSFTYWLFQ